MRILITGAAGFIGSHLVEYHLDKGDTVCGIDDLSSGVESNIKQFFLILTFILLKIILLPGQRLKNLCRGPIASITWLP